MKEKNSDLREIVNDVDKKEKSIVNEESKQKEEQGELKKQKEDKSKLNISKKGLKIIYYIILGLFAFLIRYLDLDIQVKLGDFGSLVPALLSVFILVGLKWVPLLSIIGILITIFEEFFKEISKVYLVTSGFIFVLTIIIMGIVLF